VAPRTQRKPTLDTVAAALGVSRATVSNAYNRPDQLSPAMRARVMATAAELGYAGPDPVARSLATRRSGAVGVLLDDRLVRAFADAALPVMLDGLASVIDRLDQSLILLPGTAGDGPRPEAVARAQADVIIANSLPDGSAALAAVRRRGLPLVVIDQPLVSGAPMVRVDDALGGRLAAEHLLALGHRRVAVLTFATAPDGFEGLAPDRRLAGMRYLVSRERVGSYLATLRAAGVDPPVWEAPGSARGLGRRGAAALLAGEPARRPTALLCASDELALGALEAARDAGLSVPGELSIVGFDDVPAAQATPPLTTVRQPLAEKGRLAGEQALRLLTGDRAAPSHHLTVSLVVRQSTAPHRSQHSS
jgi:DNA-binding LacI/PurR family transcriptional regulator